MCVECIDTLINLCEIIDIRTNKIYIRTDANVLEEKIMCALEKKEIALNKGYTIAKK